MKTNIFVPKKINVGFQERKDTYTGKLAYVIYFDETGKLRKETSWQNWRNQDIPNQIYDNEPMDGFVLNKKVGGVEESCGWDPRKTYVRIYDPRGFEFEITVPNLLWILGSCNSIKGKGLEGQFVYGWDGKELVLVPVESPDYQEIVRKNVVIHKNEFIKAKDLVVGVTYETVKGKRYVYMGKYDVYNTEANRYYNFSYWNPNNHRWQYPLDDTWIIDPWNKNIRFRITNKGKQFWFMELGDPNAAYSYDRNDRLCVFKTVSRKFAQVVSNECEKYSEYYEMLQKNSAFSPIVFKNTKILPLPFDNFKNGLTTHICLKKKNDFVFYFIKDNFVETCSIEYHYGDGKYYIDRVGNSYKSHYSDKNKTFVDIDSINVLYDTFKPVYAERYLANGRLDCKVGYYDKEE